MKVAVASLLPRTAAASRSPFYSSGSGFLLNSIIQKENLLDSSRIEFVNKLLDRKWGLRSPDTQIDQIRISREIGQLFGDSCCNYKNNPDWSVDKKNKKKEGQSFYVLRDDLKHPLVNGNKARKLDGLLPLLHHYSATDVVTCGGCQSAHAAAVAVLCAERGIKSHLLLRGEQPEILTGYNLISTLYGNVSYIERSTYARREDMLASYAKSLVGSCTTNGSVEWLSDYFEATKKDLHDSDSSGSANEDFKKVVIINEGAGDAISLLGMIRLVHLLSENHLFGKDQAVKIVIDAGTGTTAVGVALGALCLGLPWEVFGVMLADTIEGYRKKEESLISEFYSSSSSSTVGLFSSKANHELVHWTARSTPRKFGNVMKGEVEECKKIAQQTGILVDPVYTLAAWEMATRLAKEEETGGAKVVMLHTGGTLGMFGLAQRYKSYFQSL